jgi:hypothetical protein
VIAMDVQRIDTGITEIIIFDIQGIDIQQDLIRPIDQKNIISRQKFDQRDSLFELFLENRFAGRQIPNFLDIKLALKRLWANTDQQFLRTVHIIVNQPMLACFQDMILRFIPMTPYQDVPIIVSADQKFGRVYYFEDRPCMARHDTA